MSEYKGKPLGSIGDMGTFSFHETKNIISGEGGALLLNSETSAYVYNDCEKGTNRKAFSRGEVDKYSWVDIGSSYLPSDLIAAYLWAQMEEADAITQRRLMLWETYHQELETALGAAPFKMAVVPADCVHNAHMYYILLPDSESRDHLIEFLKNCGVHAVFHYVPLHSSKMGRKFGRVSGDLSITDDLSGRLLRLPLWLGVACTKEKRSCVRLVEL